MFAPNQRVKVNLAQMTIQGVFFSQNVQEALGTILEQTTEPVPLGGPTTKTPPPHSSGPSRAGTSIASWPSPRTLFLPG